MVPVMKGLLGTPFPSCHKNEVTGLGGDIPVGQVSDVTKGPPFKKEGITPKRQAWLEPR